MRAIVHGPVLKLRAIAGLHVVILAWDFLKQLEPTDLGEPELDALLGFSIERDEHDAAGDVVESYALRGIKRFREKDEGVPDGTPLPLDEHPVQSFCWGDYTVKPGVKYTYRVTPMHGKPKLLKARPDATASIEVTAEEEVDPNGAANGPRHDVYSNRGVIGSQAYARKFRNEEPDPDKPNSSPMKWLSRGLFEGLQAFIARADSEKYALRCAFYEFHYQPVVNALKRALDGGADVEIIYDAEDSYKQPNQAAIKAAHLPPSSVIPRTVTEGIRHNKFIVLLEKEDMKPIAVWTGSTNISASGIFGQNNIGHIVWDQAIAEAYFEYWKRLRENPTPTKLRDPNNAASPTPKAKPAENSVTPLFSPRDSKDDSPTLEWYAARMAEAKRLVCFTVAFNLDRVFQDVISQQNDVLRYIVKDDDLGKDETIGVDRDVLFAAGGHLDEGALPHFLAERDNPLSQNDYIHTKYMLVDPLGDDPLVITGSANFSRPSQKSNDENMLVIRGDTRVADIYFGEYMRIFDHHYARYLAKKLEGQDSGDPDAGYLRTTNEWVRPHLSPDSYKSKRRRYFVET